MAKLLLNLRNVDADEANDVRALLDAHGIAWYETRPSLWGVSGGGIWIADDARHAEAKRRLAEYEAQRGERVRAEHAAAKRDGTAPTFRSLLRADPLRVLIVLAAIAAIAFLSLSWFLLLRV